MNFHEPVKIEKDGKTLILNEVHGDQYNCQCPYCGRNNHYCTRNVQIEFNTYKRFKKSCIHCRKPIVFMAHYEIKVKAYTEDSDPLQGR